MRDADSLRSVPGPGSGASPPRRPRAAADGEASAVEAPDQRLTEDVERLTSQVRATTMDGTAPRSKTAPRAAKIAPKPPQERPQSAPFRTILGTSSGSSRSPFSRLGLQTRVLF